MIKSLIRSRMEYSQLTQPKLLLNLKNSPTCFPIQQDSLKWSTYSSKSAFQPLSPLQFFFRSTSKTQYGSLSVSERCFSRLVTFRTHVARLSIHGWRLVRTCGCQNLPDNYFSRARILLRERSGLQSEYRTSN